MAPAVGRSRPGGKVCRLAGCWLLERGALSQADRFGFLGFGLNEKEAGRDVFTPSARSRAKNGGIGAAIVIGSLHRRSTLSSPQIRDDY